MSLIDPTLEAILVCPVDKGDLDQDVAASRLVCKECGRRYPVEDGVAMMMERYAEGGSDE